MTLLPPKADAAALSDAGDVFGSYPGSVRASACGRQRPAAANFLLCDDVSAGAPKPARGARALPRKLRSGLSVRSEFPGFVRASVRPARIRSAFTVLELLVACAVLVIMLGFISMAISQMAKGIKTSTSKVDAFQSARAGFESVSRTLGVATLNTYWDYYDSSRNPRTAANAATFQPALYGRQSDLHFLATNDTSGMTLTNTLTAVTHGLFFQAPLGYSTAAGPQATLNPVGFFIAYGIDPTQASLSTATGLANKPRFRLYQWLPTSDSLAVDPSTGRITGSAWIAPTNCVRPLAENIVAFVVRVPDTSATTATNYGWNSLTNWPSSQTNQPSTMHQLPPLVEITMVAVEEAAVNRLAGTAATAAAAATALGGIPSFTNANDYTANLADLEKNLSSQSVPYRVFTATVPLRESRWSP